MYNDKELVCKDCGNDFTFTTGEQEFYAEKGFENEPTRCRDCRNARKNNFNQGKKEMHAAICAECGQDTKVPFMPRGDRPVYCSDCFSKQR